MRGLFLLSLVPYSFLAFLWTAQLAHASGSDYDGNGFAEIPVISASPTGDLTWSLFDPLSSKTAIFTAGLGRAGDQVILANWLYPQVTSAGILSSPSAGSGGRLVWTIRTSIRRPDGAAIQQHRKYLGRRGEIVVTGGDFDGDGFADALVLTNRGGGAYTWGLRSNFFLSSYNRGLNQNRAYFAFGRWGVDKPFFFNPDGRSDWFAVLACKSGNSCEVIATQPFTRATRRIPVGVIRDPSRVPLPVRQDDGKDLLSFISENGPNTQVEIRDLSGKLIHSHSVPMRGAITVGNYGPGPGEELCISSNGRFVVLNPVTGRESTLAGPSGEAADSININTVF